MVRVLLLILAFQLCGESVKAEELKKHHLTIIPSLSPPLAYLDSKGELKGQAITMLLGIANEINVDVSFSIAPWSRSLSIIEKNPSTLFFPLIRTPEREKNYSWIIPMREAQFHLIARADQKYKSPHKTMADIIENKDFKFGCMIRSYQCQILLDEGVPKEQIIVLNGKKFAKQAQLLERRRIDFFLGAPDTLDAYLATYDIPIGKAVSLFPVGKPLVGYLIGSKNLDPCLLMKIRDAFKKYP